MAELIHIHKMGSHRTEIAALIRFSVDSQLQLKFLSPSRFKKCNSINSNQRDAIFKLEPVTSRSAERRSPFGVSSCLFLPLFASSRLFHDEFLSAFFHVDGLHIAFKSIFSLLEMPVVSAHLFVMVVALAASGRAVSKPPEHSLLIA